MPSETILEIYTALRPHRSTAAELDAWADRLEHELAAPLTAAFVREAAAAYAERGLLRAPDEPRDGLSGSSRASSGSCGASC